MAIETPRAPQLPLDASLTAPQDAPWLEPNTDSLFLLDHRTRGRALAPEHAAPGRYLSFAHGAKTMLVALDDEVTHIGRGFTADVRFEEHRVSRRHAILVQRGSRVRLLDDRSANGTYVNGRRIVETDLQDGDVILIGPVAVRYVEVPLRAA